MEKISLPYCNNAFIIWKLYLNKVCKEIEAEIGDSYCTVWTLITSLDSIGDAISINGHKKDSRKIYINFEENGLKFEFMVGEIGKEDYKYIDISKLYFNAPILCDPKLIENLRRYMISKRIDENYFIKNHRFRHRK